MEPVTNKQNGNSTIKNIVLGLVGFFVAVIIFVVGLTVGVAAGTGFNLTGASPFVTTDTTTNTNTNTNTETNTTAGVNMTLVNDVLNRLRTQYYGEIPTSDKLTDGAIRGMVTALGDTHTQYVAPEYAKILEEDMSGTFEGIGATLRQIPGGGVQIVRTFEDSPSRKAGVEGGDLIEAVNGKTVNGLNTSEVAALIRGPKGTEVTLTLRRADKPKAFDITITRAAITIPLVTSKMLADGKVGYVSLFDFSANASAQLKSKLQDLLDQKPQAIILDLRDNPGGYLNQAVQVGDIFLKDGVFVIEKDSKGNARSDRTSNSGIAQDIPLVVLVNGSSASASEIVAGAIQDYGRGKLFGETSYGKGSVQSPQTLSNGGQLRITIQKWYTPKDRSIDGKGITPDYIVARSTADETAGRDPQLDAAVEYLLSGKEPEPTPVPTVAP
jgi:carboxyl-terminal processing protease